MPSLFGLTVGISLELF